MSQYIVSRIYTSYVHVSGQHLFLTESAEMQMDENDWFLSQLELVTLMSEYKIGVIRSFVFLGNTWPCWDTWK